MENKKLVPNHIAIIMDGNGRWAEQRGLTRVEGHRAGVKHIQSLIRHLYIRGVKFVTLYAFSTENWHRPEGEVNGIFRILHDVTVKESKKLNKYGIRIRHLGSLAGLPEETKADIKKAEDLTAENTGMVVSIALNYGGRAEIIEAVRRIAASGLKPSEIDEKVFRSFLYVPDLPDVDLVVRTGGEMRISNLLIWQTAYSEYYFTPVLWPDFNVPELKKALSEFSRRKRRFGGLNKKA
jgi:undecaprenyl diphosphate synthase